MHMSRFAAVAAAYDDERARSAILRETLSNLLERTSRLVEHGSAVSDEHAPLIAEIQAACARAEEVLQNPLAACART